jgi:hypothetical protein
VIRNPGVRGWFEALALALAFVLALCASTAYADEPTVIVEPTPPATPPRAVVQAGPVMLDVGALVQLDAARGGPRPGYGVPRTRVRLGARLEKLLHLGVRLQAEMSPLAEQRGLLDALIELRLASRGLPDLGRLSLGQMKVPFSAEVLDDPEDLVLLERPQGARRLAPGRDIGLSYAVRLVGGADPLVLRLGIFNGEGPGRICGGSGSMDVVRLSGPVGDASRARLGGRWGLALAVNPDAALADGRAVALLYGGDLAVRYRELQLGAELVWRTADRGPDAGAAWAWLAVDVIPEVLQAIARAETLDEGGGDGPERWLTLGGTFFYLGRRFRLAYEVMLPLAPQRARSSWQVASFMAVL